MLILEIERGVADDLKGQLDALAVESTVVQSDRFEGVSDVVALLVPLTAGSVTALAKVVIEAIRARRHIRIKHRGFEIVGISENTAEKILRELLKKEK